MKVRSTILSLVLLALTSSGFSQVTRHFEKLGIQAQQDDISRFYLAPKRIVWQSDKSGEKIRNAEILLKEGDGQTRFRLSRDSVCQIINEKKDTSGILLDFGIEIHGGIQLTTATSNRKTPRVRIRFGESVSEAMSRVIGDGTTGLEGGATNHHAMRDFEVTLPGYGTLEIGNSGFRFVRIDLLDSGARVDLEEIRAVAVIRDIPFLGSFQCSDTLLNQIWDTGAYTVLLNMQDFLWDGIKRDRMIWMGDMHPELMTVCTVFGDNDLIEKSLDYGRNSTPLPNWMNGISAYSMWWIIMQYDWYLYQGDLDYLRKQRNYLAGLLRTLMDHVGKDNSENLEGGMRFLDWPSRGNKECVHAGLQALMVMSFQKGGKLLNMLGDTEMARVCMETEQKMRSHIPDPNGCKQAGALLVLADMLQAEKANKEIIAVDGVKNFSTFYGYYMLQAQARAGDYQTGIDNIRTFWGAMLKLGATTFWEDFNMDWTENAAGITEIVPEGMKDIHKDFGAYSYLGLRHSLCHGWSSGPTSWLSQNVLGITPVEPGFKVFRVEPHLGDLEWAEGSFPTPYGVIKVSHKKLEDGSILTTVDAPEGLTMMQD